MRFITSIFAGAALIAAAYAQKVQINEAPMSVEAGKSYEVTYGPATSDATTFILRKGLETALKNLTTLTNSATGGKYTWNVDRGLVDGDDYALMIIQNGEGNFWGPIKLTGGSGKSSSAVSSSATPTPSSASSASSASTTASASASASSSGNNTVSSATLSSTGGASSSTSRPSTTSSASGPPQSTGAAASLGSSPLALIFGAVAAMAYLN
ncbi:hypothetical protein P154DRAFT_623361 [Amniculicola lignicola CBS 123094]|uniref:Yeast cell wall synthesis Kre9/Knh1-like N-terminal domain-containing protein n=1 Tax=Amniculicola lignicola CBS 123094 TaxID=1392246 RepID=A0A6A5W4T4_9PLEO|nr:hypothetical protein P154DRAFT_623361 [Amniculicola lignicola CBS 123094]